MQLYPILFLLALGAPSEKPLFELPEAQPGIAPSPPIFPNDLPAPLEAPKDGVWLGIDNGKIEYGTFLPNPLNEVIRDHLDYFWSGYQSVCQASIDSALAIERTRCDGAIRVSNAQLKAQLATGKEDVCDSWICFDLIDGAMIAGIASSIGLLTGFYMAKEM